LRTFFPASLSPSLLRARHRLDTRDASAVVGHSFLRISVCC
jgi:hypothetical protein